MSLDSGVFIRINTVTFISFDQAEVMMEMVEVSDRE